MAHLVAIACGAHAAAQSNPIQVENALPGTTAWQLTTPADSHEIEGFASATSIDHCSPTPLRLYVNTTAPQYRVEVYRLGWYNGLGGRLIAGPTTAAATPQPAPTPNPQTGLIECNWSTPFLLQPSCSWVSGVYVAKLTAIPGGRQCYVHFVVRDDARSSLLLFQCSVTTYQAYNDWGGKSLYGDATSHAARVSFNRPYLPGWGSGQFFSYEYDMVRWLEAEGYDVTYGTNVDTHRSLAHVLAHQAFLSVGHDEYWSWEMRTNVQTARDLGIHLAFFSANTCFWQIRLDPSTIDGAASRVITCYKDDALQHDPVAIDGNPSNDYLITRTWRDNGRPENMLIGVMLDVCDVGVNADLVITNAGHWVFAGTGAQNGQTLAGLVGYEADRRFSPEPPGVETLAHSPVPPTQWCPVSPSDMTAYTAPSGAIIFATGTIQWAWGLDDFACACAATHSPLMHPVARQMTRNVLGRLSQSPYPGVWVDFAHAGNESGAFTQPYNTIAEGVSAAAAGETIRIKSGHSNETLRITRSVGLTSWHGAAVIGR